MSRPKKRTVDYFPHTVKHGQLIFLLKQRYKNDGYAFWFQLLELLGDSDDHYIDLNREAAWEYFQAYVGLPAKKCTEILNLLARLGKIDPELWKKKIVWCQSFVDNIADVYRIRRSEIPTRPVYLLNKPKGVGVSGVRKKVAEDKHDPADTESAVNHYIEKFKKTFRTAPDVSYAKDKKILKDLIKNHGLGTVKRVIDLYLADSDKLARENGYSIGVMKSKFNKYLIQVQSINVVYGSEWAKRDADERNSLGGGSR